MNKGTFLNDKYYPIFYQDKEVHLEGKSISIDEYLDYYFAGEDFKTVKDKLNKMIESEKVDLFPDKLICKGKQVDYKKYFSLCSFFSLDYKKCKRNQEIENIKKMEPLMKSIEDVFDDDNSKYVSSKEDFI